MVVSSAQGDGSLVFAWECTRVHKGTVLLCSLGRVMVVSIQVASEKSAYCPLVREGQPPALRSHPLRARRGREKGIVHKGTVLLCSLGRGDGSEIFPLICYFS